MLPIPLTDPGMSPAEQLRRQEAVDFAIANSALSGYRVTPEQIALAARYVAGDLDLTAFMAESARLAAEQRPPARAPLGCGGGI